MKGSPALSESPLKSKPTWLGARRVGFLAWASGTLGLLLSVLVVLLLLDVIRLGFLSGRLTTRTGMAQDFS